MISWWKIRISDNKDFKIQRRNGKENFAEKVNLSSSSVYRDYSYPPILSNVGGPSWSGLQGTISKFRREIKFRRCSFTFSIPGEIRHFHLIVVQKRQRNIKKSVMRVQSCCFAYYFLVDVLFAVASLDLKIPACNQLQHSRPWQSCSRDAQYRKSYARAWNKNDCSVFSTIPFQEKNIVEVTLFKVWIFFYL